MLETMYCGVDVSKEKHAIQLLAPSGAKAGRLQVDNTPAGANLLTEEIAAAARRLGCTEICIGLEATSVYWWHLFRYFFEAPQLAGYSTKVTLINPRRVKDFRRSLGELPKNDRMDAFVIADFLRANANRLRFSLPPDPRFDSIRSLTRARYQLAKILGGEKNRALAVLFRTFSAYGRGKPFSDVFGLTSMHVVSELTVSEIATLSLPQLAERVFGTAHAFFSSGEQERITRELAHLAAASYRLDAFSKNTMHKALKTHLDLITFLDEKIKILDGEIAECFRPIPSTLQTIPGIGPVYEAGIRSESGPIERYRSDGQLAAMAGLVWKEHQSGNFKAEEERLTSSGNRCLRYYLVEAANVVRMHDERFAAYYKQKYEEAQHHQHKRALLLTARKLTRTVFVLLKRGLAYDPQRRAS